MSYKVGSMFAGVGGICLGFKLAGANVIWANEIDKNACITYRENFGSDYLIEGDIQEVNTDDIPELDILTAGFPCQAFSVAGYRKGFEDDRGNLFFQIVRVLEEKKPKAFLLENVKNLVTHDKGNTFKVIKEHLLSLGYYIDFKILNSMEYGNVPQNRERIYIVGFLDEEEQKKFKFPEKIQLNKTIHDILENDSSSGEKYYYTEDSQYYPMLVESMNKKDTIYQLRRIYVRENKSNVCPTLTANMGTGGHNVPLVLEENGIRKLTPRECFKFQGFPLSYKIPKQISKGNSYKQAGNAVTVSVIERIARNMMDAMGNASNEKELHFSLT